MAPKLSSSAPMRTLLLRWFSPNTLHFMKLDVHFMGVSLRDAVTSWKMRPVKPSARFLNVGCGRLGLKSPDWCNVDGWPGDGVDHVCDLRGELPFSPERFDGIFAEHVFEHLRSEDAAAFLRECLRLLRSGSVLRLSVPDGELFIKNYSTDRAWMLEQLKSREWLDLRASSELTPMAMLNEVFRQANEHQFCYDYETLALCLLEAGFASVERVAFRQGGLPGLLIDAASRKVESLYVEARKA